MQKKDSTSSPHQRGPASSRAHATESPLVSKQMVDAGLAVLWRSGAVEVQLGSDKLLVAEIFEAMSSAAPR